MARHACGMGLQVCLWHLADMLNALTNVRFEGNNGHDADVTRCLLMTQGGHSERIASRDFAATKEGQGY